MQGVNRVEFEAVAKVQNRTDIPQRPFRGFPRHGHNWLRSQTKTGLLYFGSAGWKNVIVKVLFVKRFLPVTMSLYALQSLFLR